MRLLFFVVHPSKYHLFRRTINALTADGHEVDLAIVTKDVLESLVQAEGWSYTNVYPEGRRGALPASIALPWHSLRTIWRLWRLTRGRSYDLYVTDDLLAVVGRLRRVPTIMFTDDDLSAVPEAALLYALMTRIVAPTVTDLGRFNDRKISYDGLHELAYLHPRYFSPDPSVIASFNPGGDRYSILRLVSLTATHDRGKTGVTNQQLSVLIELLERHGKVFISSERPLPEQFERHRIRIPPHQILHALSQADLFIGDSQTMTTEAAILGTPSLRFNDFVGRIRSMEHLEQAYGLTYGFRTDQFDQLVARATEILSMPDAKAAWAAKRAKLVAETVDVNEVILDTILSFDPGARAS